jgi:tRNA pseudouridine32 synthase/23S rRNA pseudouridine746 synthase
MKPRLLWENDDAVAVEKPSGIPTIPGRGDVGRPMSALLEEALGKKVWIVHRLDLDASGVVVFAKSAAAHKRLCADFEHRRARKRYLALVEGEPKDEGRIDAPLREFGSGRVGVGEGGKLSSTRYAVRARGLGCALLDAEPLTGRRHQLRVHLYSIGHPILGDRLYGKTRPVGAAPRLMLHALSLELPGLPVLECPPPEDFRDELSRRSVA